MKEIRFYFDVISPYAWLAFQALPRTLDGIAHRVHYHPVVFGAMLEHHGQLGPAETRRQARLDLQASDVVGQATRHCATNASIASL
jgi:2-hydroxychromene-2-carboxylate isomerase